MEKYESIDFIKAREYDRRKVCGGLSPKSTRGGLSCDTANAGFSRVVFTAPLVDGAYEFTFVEGKEARSEQKSGFWSWLTGLFQ